MQPLKSPHLDQLGRLVLPHIPEPGPHGHPLDKAMWAIADALRNPVSPDGTIYDLRFVNIPVLARHLARAGIGPVADQAVIRAVDAPGGYRQWVAVDAPDPQSVDLNNTPLSELDPDDPRVRELVAQRFGGETAAPPKPPDGWRVRPSIKLDEEC